MQIVTGRRGEPHVTSRQMQAVYRSFLGDFALFDVGTHLAAAATAIDNVRISDGVVAVQGIYAVIAYNEYDDSYIEPVSVGMKRIDTLILHYTKSNDIEDMQIEVVEGEEVVDNPVAPTIAEGGDAWEGTADIKVPIYDVLVTSFGLTVTPYSRMNTLIPTLDSIAERIPESIVTGVKGDSEVLYRNGNVNITKANVGLGDVDNTSDLSKPISNATQTALNLKADLVYVDAKIASAYHAGGSKTVAELTSALLIADNMGKVYNMSDSGTTTSDFVEGAGEPINEGDNVGICNVGTEENPVYKFDLLSGFVDLSAYVTTSALNTRLAEKVDKVPGKGLSTNDYTTADKNKLAGIEAEANKTVVDSSMSTTSTNPLQNKVITAELAGATTATGNPLTIESAESNLVECVAEVEPVQDLHGYDHPWVGGAGKNKLPMTVEGIKNVNTSGTWSGNVYTINNVTFEILVDSDGNVIGIKTNGTASANTNLILIRLTGSQANSLFGNNNYYLSGCASGGSNNSYYLRILTDPWTIIATNTTDNSTSFSTDSTLSTYNLVICVIGVDSGINMSGKIFYPMIRLSTETDSSFAPYTNICPITGQTEVVITQKDNLTNPTVTKTYTIQLGDTIYGGTLDVTRGELVVDKVLLELDGSNDELFSLQSINSYGIANFSIDSANFNPQRIVQEYCITNEFEEQTTIIANTTTMGFLDGPTFYIRVLSSYASTVSKLRTWLSNNPLQICYKLATPFTIDLTPQQIRLLKGTNHLSCNTGDLSIKYYPDNVLGQLKGDIEKGLNAYYDYQIQALWDKINELQA